MTAKPLATLASLAVCAALLVGCGDDGDPETGPTDGPSQSDSPTDEAPTSPATTATVPVQPDPPSTGPDDEPSEPLETDDDDPAPADATELCDVFSAAYDALIGGGAELPTDETSPLSPELIDALRDWGQGIEDADLPSDLTDDEREGLGIMSRLLLAIPDDATGEDLDALDADLAGDDDDKVDAASEWVDENCDLDL